MLVHRRVTPSSKFAGTHLYTWVERGTMGVKCLAQEHNAVPRPGLEPGTSDAESSALTIRPPRLPLRELKAKGKENRSYSLFSLTVVILTARVVQISVTTNQDRDVRTSSLFVDQSKKSPDCGLCTDDSSNKCIRCSLFFQLRCHEK